MAEDRFANIATLEVTASAANALTFQELRTNVGIDADRKTAIAMLIDEIDYHPSGASIGEMTTSGDTIQFGLTISNAVTDLLDASDRRILHNGFMVRRDLGTAAGGVVLDVPKVFQFFPPMITAERSLFLATQTAGLATANVLRARIYYRTVGLTQGEFLEIAEVFRLVG